MRKKNRYNYSRFANKGQLEIYKELKRKVLARDHYTCRWPGCKTNTDLDLHHVLPWSKYPRLRFVSTNLICLCKAHHKLVTGKEELFANKLFAILNTSNKEAFLNNGKPKYQGKYKYKKGPSKRKPQRKPKFPNH